MEKSSNLNWQSYPFFQNDLAALECDWLLHAGSFMQRLREHGIDNPEVQVLQESWQVPLQDEAQQLNLESHDQALVREVLIKSHDAVWMYARTIFPKGILQGKWQELAHLQNRSLGSVLFADPDVRRGEFEIGLLMPDMAWHQEIAQFADIYAKKLWARRSVFFIENKRLLLIEVFMPEVLRLP